MNGAEGNSRVVLVTGAGSGIGRASAEVFASEGAYVIAADIDAPLAAETAELVGANRCVGLRLDVTKRAEIDDLVKDSTARYGRLDVLHNNAGVGAVPQLLHNVSDEEWNRIMDVDLRGAWYMMAAALRVMRGQRSGVIVNTASIAATTALASRGPYCAAKAGLVALTKVAALENAEYGIRVNAVSPGTITTPMSAEVVTQMTNSMGSRPLSELPITDRPGSPEEVARAVAWLASPDSSFVNGACLPVDGGWTLAPPSRFDWQRTAGTN